MHKRGEEFGTLGTGARVKESRGVRDYGQGVCMREEFGTLGTGVRVKESRGVRDYGQGVPE